MSKVHFTKVCCLLSGESVIVGGSLLACLATGIIGFSLSLQEDYNKRRVK